MLTPCLRSNFPRISCGPAGAEIRPFHVVPPSNTTITLSSLCRKRMFPSVPQKSSERDSPVYRKLRERQTQQGRQIDRETNLLSRRCLPTSKTILLSTFLTRVSSRVNVLKEHKLWYEDVKRQGQACQRSTKTKYEVHGDGGEKNILSRVL
jgi:hypothetical protein